MYLQLNFLNIDEWCKLMKLPHVSCDELMLHVLSVAHSRHTIVYTAKCIWTTVNNINQLSVPELHSMCDVHLAYLRGHMYDELKQRPLHRAPLPILSPPVIPGKRSNRKWNTVPLDLRVSSTDDADSIATSRKSRNNDSNRIIRLFEKYSTHEARLDRTCESDRLKEMCTFTEVKSLRNLSKMCIATCIPRLTEDLLQGMFQKVQPKTSIDTIQVDQENNAPTRLDDMCVTLIRKRIPDFEKSMCAEFFKQPRKSPEGLKHRCIEVLKSYIPNYSEDLVKRLTHRTEIKNPDRLRQLCLQKL